MSDGTPDRTKTVIACADNIPVLVVSFPPGVNAPPPGEKVMIEIGEPRPGQYANVALQPVKGKTAYIGPLSRAALTIMQTAGNQTSSAVDSEACTIPNRDHWIDMPPLTHTHFNGTAQPVTDHSVQRRAGQQVRG